MPDPSAEQRLTQLIGRTYRLKISVLVLLLVSLLVLWSTLTGGQHLAEQIDEDFCQQLAGNAYYGFSGIASSACDGIASQYLTISLARNMHNNYVADRTKTIPDQAADMDRYLSRIRQFQDYDQRRRFAYKIEVSFPYTKGSIFLDGVLIADVWPLFAISALAVTILLGFKERCYEIHLAALLKKVEPKDARATQFALSEFRSGSLTEASINGELVFAYRRPFVLSPEGILGGALYLAVSLVSLRLFTDYSPQFSARGYQIFSGYYFWIYVFSVVVAILLARTRTVWRGSLADALGGQVSTVWSLRWKNWRWFGRDHLALAQRVGNAYVLVLGVLAVGSLCLPVADSFRGYELIWRPSECFPDAPMVGRVLQLCLICFLDFVLLCLSLAVLARSRHRGGRVGRDLCRLRYLYGWLVLLLIGFPISYTVIGNYGWFMDSYLLPILGAGINDRAIDTLLKLQSFDIGETGWGARVFLGCCFGLAVNSLLFRDPPKMVRDAGRELT
jgi:hypothetical protein